MLLRSTAFCRSYRMGDFELRTLVHQVGLWNAVIKSNEAGDIDGIGCVNKIRETLRRQVAVSNSTWHLTAG